MKLASIAIAVLAVAGVVAALAIAQGAEGPPSQLPPDELSSEAARASGQPGDRVPPCPTEPVVDQLKDAGMAFGPCIPVPDGLSTQERAELLADAPIVKDPTEVDEPEAPASEGTCTAISARTEDGEIIAKLPCDARITDENYLKQNGRSCLEVTSVDASTAVKTPTTDIFCAE